MNHYKVAHEFEELVPAQESEQSGLLHEPDLTSARKGSPDNCCRLDRSIPNVDNDVECKNEKASVKLLARTFRGKGKRERGKIREIGVGGSPQPVCKKTLRVWA